MPDERPLALVTATSLEMRHAVRGLADPAAVPETGAVRLRLAGREVVALVCGVGPVNAALTVGAFFGSGARVSGLLNLGVAGSFDCDKAGPGRPVAATAEIWPEYGVVGEDGLADARALAFPQFVDGAGRVWDALSLDPAASAERLGLTLPGDWPVGPSVTVAGVTGSPARATALRARFGALTENMEGFPLALACRARETSFLEIRIVSNPVGERDRAKWRMKEALEGLGHGLAVLLGQRPDLPNA